MFVAQLAAVNKTADEINSILIELYTHPLISYQAFAIGMGLDDYGYFMAIVIIHADTEAAKQNIQTLEQRIGETSTISTDKRWSDLISIMETESHELIIFAKLYGENIGYGESIGIVYGEELRWRLLPLLSCSFP